MAFLKSDDLRSRLRLSVTVHLIILAALTAGVVLTNQTWPLAVIAQTSGQPDGVSFVPVVPGQLRALTEQADPIGFPSQT